jgi:DNA-binding NtrC family response regulator
MNGRPQTSETRPPQGRVVVVDDDRRMASATAQWLCSLGWHASAAAGVDESLPLLSRGPCDACVIDGLLPGDGVARLVATVRAAAPAAGIVIGLPAAMAAAAGRPGGAGALPAGCGAADAFVATPMRDDELLAALARACASGRKRLAVAAPTAAATAAVAAERRVLGAHPSILQVLDVVDRIADTPATVLITGESGTGKSLVARAIHQASRRRTGRFVEVACGSLSESLLESELFGHVAGAFTGATVDRDGKFLQADGGTIFLDEIATASPAMQVKLLRVLQDFEFESVGGSRTHRVDARVILATHEHLQGLVAQGSFRADLYWRINVVAIEMPALRSRASDIPLLATHFLARAVAKAGRRVEGFTAAALDALLRHGWPGNVRELEHAVERAVFLGRGPLIDIADLPPAVAVGWSATGGDRAGGARPAASLKRAMAVPERQLILDALRRHGWRRDEAARSLGITRTTLYKKAKRLGMDLSALDPSAAVDGAVDGARPAASDHASRAASASR